MTSQHEALVKECRFQAESCLYTSTAMYAWLESATFWNKLWNALPIALGALASFSFLADWLPALAAVLALIAGVLPSIYQKLGLKAHTNEILSQAGQYKNLENRFRQAAEIASLDEDSNALKMEFASLMKRIEDVRARPLAVPEKHFQAGRKKVKDGRYSPDVETVS